MVEVSLLDLSISLSLSLSSGGNEVCRFSNPPLLFWTDTSEKKAVVMETLSRPVMVCVMNQRNQIESDR